MPVTWDPWSSLSASSSIGNPLPLPISSTLIRGRMRTVSSKASPKGGPERSSS
ncbi:MAG: hypothetical protein MZV64_71760 [Ignavibacteriales bacterium]|nr:hypothetical protein [Ignavibacteriales bacterium]